MGIDPNTPFSITDPNLGPAYLNKMAEIEAGQPQPFPPEAVPAGIQMAQGAQNPWQSMAQANMATSGPPGKDAQVAIQQQLLKAAGFDPGPIDGVAGPQTKAAIQAYNSAKLMNPTAFTGDNSQMLDRLTSASPAAASMASTPPSLLDVTAVQPGDVKASPTTGADQVVRASIEGDPSHLTEAWNNVVSRAITGGKAVQDAGVKYFSELPVAAKTAMASSFAWQPGLLKSVPALGWPGQPTVRDTAASEASSVLTGGHAASQLGGLGMGPGMVSEPVYDDTHVTPSPAERPTPAPSYSGSGAAAFPSPTKDPLQTVQSGYKGYIPGGMATTPPPVTPPGPAMDESMAYGLSNIVGSPVSNVGPAAGAEPMAYAPIAPAAKAPSMASVPPSKGLGGRVYNAIAQPTRPGSSSFWTGPMTQPFFTPGGGGATMPYQSNTGMSTTDVHGNKVSLGVYTDTQGNQHTYELG